MRRHGWMLFLVAVLVLLLLIYTVSFAVSFRQLGIVATFGRAAEPLDGRQSEDQGLHAKLPWPIQQLTRYDSRIHVFDDTHDEIPTSDRQNVLITVFCGWRIPDAAGAARFYEKVRTVKKAEAALRDLVRKEKGNVVGGRPLSDFLNTERTRIPEIERAIQQAVRAEAKRRYGIDIVTLGIKSLGLPEKVTKEVIGSMQSERKQYADAYREQGRAQGELIRARAQAARDQILAFAEARAKAIRAEGDRAVARMLDAYGKNPQLAVLMLEIDFVRKALKENTVVLGSEWLQRSLGFFRDGASVAPQQGPPATAPAAGAVPAGN